MDSIKRLVLLIFFMLWGCQYKENSLSTNHNSASNRNASYVLQDSAGRQQLEEHCPIKEEMVAVKGSDLLYRAKNGGKAIHLKVSVSGDFYEKEYLDRCPSLLFGYASSIVYNGDIVTLEKVIDVASFRSVENSKVFFKDRNRVYAFQETPVSYPAFSIIDIDPRKATILKKLITKKGRQDDVFAGNYIKDDRNVYYLGMHISTHAPEFKYIPNGNGSGIFGDGHKILYMWNDMSREGFDNSIFSESLRKKLLSEYWGEK